jgi:peptide/nickel transport system permease protein
MIAYVGRRLAFALATVLSASVVSFLLVHASGSTPGQITAGAGASAARVAAANRALGWDRPLVTQYLAWLGRAARGNLGVSLIDGHNIWNDLVSRLPVTASIAVFATLVSGILGVLIGVAAAVRGGRLDRAVTVGSGVVLSLPPFCLPPATCRSPPHPASTRRAWSCRWSPWPSSGRRSSRGPPAPG